MTSKAFGNLLHKHKSAHGEYDDDDGGASPSLGVFNSLGVMELEHTTGNHSSNSTDELEQGGNDDVYDLSGDSSEDSSVDDDAFEDIHSDMNMVHNNYSDTDTDMYAVNLDDDEFNTKPSAEIACSFNGVDEYVHKAPTGTKRDVFMDWGVLVREEKKKMMGIFKKNVTYRRNNDSSNNTSYRLRRFDTKYVVGPMAMLLLVCSVSLGLFLSSSSRNSDDNDGGIGDDVVALINKGEKPLSKHGYRYDSHTSSGWLTWPQNETDANFKSFGDKDGVTSVEECAAKCDEVEAHAGAWSVRYNGCWCRLGNLDDMCKEPCVEEEYVEFSTVPFTDFDYCDKSICNKGWTHQQSYCEDTIKFDADACDDKINLIEDELFQAPSDIDMAADEDQTIIKHDDEQVIAPTAIATLKHDQPHSTNGGEINMSVSGQCFSKDGDKGLTCKHERISYVRFALNTYQDLTTEDVTKVTLHLYVTNHFRNDDTNEPFEVQVASLPHQGSWKEGSHSWKKPFNEKDSIKVDTVKVDQLDAKEKKKCVDVDVTDAFISQLTEFKKSTFTVKLSTKHDGRLDFAGMDWNGGDSAPQLIIEMAESDVSK